jgi:hypothetical protein
MRRVLDTVTTVQQILARYAQPEGPDAAATMHELLGVLDARSFLGAVERLRK